MNLVTIYHPGLDRESDVPAASVPLWRVSGWQEGPRPDPAEEPAENPGEEPAAPDHDQKPQGQADAPESTPPTPRRRRAPARQEE